MEYIPVAMVRPDMADIPQHPLPAGYSMRMFRPGDEATWVRVWQASEVFEKISPSHFAGSFGYALAAMPRRCYFLQDAGGEDVGTITAWWNPTYQRRRWGQIHWVAVTPAHRGKGLAKGMMTVAMNRLRALGHRRAMLFTQTPRLGAIKVYLDFGFAPVADSEKAVYAWGLVAAELDHPALAGLRK